MKSEGSSTSHALRQSQKTAIRGTRVPIIRSIVNYGLYWDPIILGNYHFTESPRQDADHMPQPATNLPASLPEQRLDLQSYTKRWCDIEGDKVHELNRNK